MKSTVALRMVTAKPESIARIHDLLNRRRFGEALAEAQACLAAAPLDVEATLLTGACLRWTSQFGAAERLYKKAYERQPDREVFLARYAAMASEIHHHFDAVGRWLKVVERHPHAAVGYLGVVDALHAVKRFDCAAELIERSAVQWEDDVEFESMRLASIEKTAEWLRFTQRPEVLRIFDQKNAPQAAHSLLKEGEFHLAEVVGWVGYYSGAHTRDWIEFMQIYFGGWEGVRRAYNFLHLGAQLFPDDLEKQLEYGAALLERRAFDDSMAHLQSCERKFGRDARLDVLFERILGQNGQESADCNRLDWDFCENPDEDALLLAGRKAAKLARSGDIDSARDIQRWVSLQSILKDRSVELPAAAPSCRRVENGPKLRVAVCVSGQLRGWESTCAFLRGCGSADVELDIFVHTWNSVGVPINHEQRTERLFDAAIAPVVPVALQRVANFARQFPNAFRMLDEATITEDRLKCAYAAKAVVVEAEQSFETGTLSEGLRCGRGWNQAKMFYKMHACHELMRDHAQAAGMVYDYVVRVRPDLWIKGLNWRELERLTCMDDAVAVNYVLKRGISDQFAFGRPRAMEIFMSPWLHMTAHGHAKYLPGLKGQFGEELLFAHTFIQGVDARVVREGEFGSLMPPLTHSEHFLETLAGELTPYRSQAEFDAFAAAVERALATARGARGYNTQASS